jgi:hypothetical protein
MEYTFFIFKKWWPAVIIVILFIIAAISKYFIPNIKIYSMTVDSIKAIGVLTLVVYAIYTRSLALDTGKMAEASLGLYESERGAVHVYLTESNVSYNSLTKKAQEATETIHIQEKKIQKDEFDALVKKGNIPAVCCKIKNSSGRQIHVSKITYFARHTGTEKGLDIILDINEIGTVTINPLKSKTIPLIVAPEGEVEVTVSAIEYLDGTVVQRANIIKSTVKLERIRVPTPQEETPNA